MRNAITVVVGVLLASTAWAQEANPPRPAAERRPFRGIFSGLSTPRTPQSLVFSASLFGAYDNNVLAGLSESGARDWRLHRSGPYWGGVAALDYSISRTGNRFSVGGQAGAAVRYYRHSNLSSFAPDSHAAGNFRFAITRSTSLAASHQVLYSRQYSFHLVPTVTQPDIDDVAVTITPDLDLFQLSTLRNTSNVSLTQNLWRYASVSGAYNLRYLHLLDDERPDGDDGPDRRQLRNYRTQSGSFRFQYDRPITAHATVNLGYGLRVSDAELGTGEPEAMHDIRAGLSYSRALSISRRTSISFATGSAAAVSERIDDDPESEARTHFRLTGTAALVHEMGRTWTARASYHRGFQFHEGFNEPFFTESVHAGVGGLVTRRLSFSAAGTWALSKLERSGRPGQTLFSGTAQSTYALTSLLALFAQYVYYEYNFDAGVPLDARFPRALDRHGVRAGITASVPLLR